MLIIIIITFQGPLREPSKVAKQGHGTGKGPTSRVENEPLLHKDLMAPTHRPGPVAPQADWQRGGKVSSLAGDKLVQQLENRQPCLWKVVESISPLTGLASDLVCGGSEGLWGEGCSSGLGQCQGLCSHSLRTPPVTAQWRPVQPAGEQGVGKEGGQHGLQPCEQGHQTLRDHTVPSHISHSVGKSLLSQLFFFSQNIYLFGCVGS